MNLGFPSEFHLEKLTFESQSHNLNYSIHITAFANDRLVFTYISQLKQLFVVLFILVSEFRLGVLSLLVYWKLQLYFAGFVLVL